MPRIHLTRRAIQDMDDIWLHIAQDNPTAADTVIDAIHYKTELAATQPMMGTARLELADHLRSIVEGHYVIFYRPIADGIEIVRVIHDARDIDNAFI